MYTPHLLASIKRSMSSALRPLTGRSLLTSSFLRSTTFMPEKSGASVFSASSSFAFFFGFSSSGSGADSSAAGAFSSGAGDPFVPSLALLRSSNRFFAASGTCTEYLISSSSSPSVFTVIVFVRRFGSAGSAGSRFFSAITSSNDLGAAGTAPLGFCALPAPMVGAGTFPSLISAARAAAAARNLAFASIAEAFGAAAAGFVP
mmetsp:Transcript_7645/g.21165  ORF Transcript_7645/g.21165 Transcript_7645/m.21165 type:complete len:203 (+) Transcript_7645:101-709(+)